MSNLGGKTVSEDTDKDNQGLDSVVAGTNITSIDNTDPRNPIINAAGASSTVTTKGDLVTYDTAENRLPVGTNAQVLTADSAQALGVKWATPAAGVDFKGALIERSTDLARTATAIETAFLVEVYDTDAFGDLGTDNDRLTIPANVTKVRVHGFMDALNIAAGSNCFIYINHLDSGDSLVRQYGSSFQNGNIGIFGDISTPVIDVSSGDYFVLWTGSSDSSWTQKYISLSLEYKDGTL